MNGFGGQDQGHQLAGEADCGPAGGMEHMVKIIPVICVTEKLGSQSLHAGGSALL